MTGAALKNCCAMLTQRCTERKDQGRNTYQYFTADMNKRAFEMLAFRNSLHKALDNEEFLIHYQPFVDVRTNRIIAAEALLRWQHPQYGLVYPGRFIPLAEEI